MKNLQLESPDLKSFFDSKQNEIIGLAKEAADNIARKEFALMEFELLLAAHMTEKDIMKLEKESRSLRTSSWKELESKFGNNTSAIQNYLENI